MENRFEFVERNLSVSIVVEEDETLLDVQIAQPPAPVGGSEDEFSEVDLIGSIGVDLRQDAFKLGFVDFTVGVIEASHEFFSADHPILVQVQGLESANELTHLVIVEHVFEQRPINGVLNRVEFPEILEVV